MRISYKTGITYFYTIFLLCLERVQIVLLIESLDRWYTHTHNNILKRFLQIVNWNDPTWAKEVWTWRKHWNIFLARNEYWQYYLDMISWSHGLPGLSNNEINHSSVLCYMNDDHTKTNRYCEGTIILVKDLLRRGRQHNYCVLMHCTKTTKCCSLKLKCYLDKTTLQE